MVYAIVFLTLLRLSRFGLEAFLFLKANRRRTLEDVGEIFKIIPNRMK